MNAVEKLSLPRNFNAGKICPRKNFSPGHSQPREQQPRISAVRKVRMNVLSRRAQRIPRASLTTAHAEARTVQGLPA